MSNQQNKDKPNVTPRQSNQELEADFLLNKHVFRTAAYSVAGFGLGLAASLLFFKHKATMTVFFAGTGAGYGASGFTHDWSHYKHYRNWSQRQGQREQQGGDVKQGIQNFERFVSNQFNQSQKGGQDQQRDNQRQDRSNQQRDDHRQDRQDQQRDNQRQDRSNQQRDDHRQDKQDQHRDTQKQDKSNQQKDDHKQDQKSQQKDDHKQDKSSQDKSSQNKSDNQNQQKNDKDSHKKADSHSQQNQQNKPQGQSQHGKGEPMNAQAKQNKDVTNQDLDKPAGKQQVGTGQPQSPIQINKNKQEDSVYSQTNQGSADTKDEHQLGQKGSQNSSIPPSKKDHTGGHANQGVHQGQVHRGNPEDDKMGKSVGPKTSAPQTKQREATGEKNQALSNVDMKGQNLQTFQSNTLPLGKSGLTHEIQTNYQDNRNRANDKDLDNLRRTQHGLEQDRLGQSIKEGIIHKVRDSSDTQAGVGNYRGAGGEQSNKNQVNAVLE